MEHRSKHSIDHIKGDCSTPCQLPCVIITMLSFSHTQPADRSVPPTLLEDILQTELPVDIFSANVSGLQDESNLVSSLHNLLATQLDVSMATISNVRVSTVEKDSRPLVQVTCTHAHTHTHKHTPPHTPTPHTPTHTDMV